jgi:hypothetical protein
MGIAVDGCAGKCYVVNDNISLRVNVYDVNIKLEEEAQSRLPPRRTQGSAVDGGRDSHGKTRG